MKKTTTLVVMLSAFLLISTTAQAVVNPGERAAREDMPSPMQDRATDDMPAQIAEEAQEQVQENQEARIQIQQAGEENQERGQVREQIREQALNRVAQVHARRVQRRFDFYSQRLNTIADKLQNRLQALEAEGLDVSAAQEKLDEALQMVEVGMTQAQEATNQLNKVDLEQDLSQREMALEARDQIQEARANFMQAVELMKEAVQAAITAGFDAVE